MVGAINTSTRASAASNSVRERCKISLARRYSNARTSRALLKTRGYVRAILGVARGGNHPAFV